MVVQTRSVVVTLYKPKSRFCHVGVWMFEVHHRVEKSVFSQVITSLPPQEREGCNIDVQQKETKNNVSTAIQQGMQV